MIFQTYLHGPDSCSGANIEDSLHVVAKGSPKKRVVHRRDKNMMHHVATVLLLFVVWELVR